MLVNMRHGDNYSDGNLESSAISENIKDDYIKGYIGNIYLMHLSGIIFINLLMELNVDVINISE
jgi:hypothetical protein